MSDGGPKEIIQSAEQPTTDLHRGIGNELRKKGHPDFPVAATSEAPIPLSEELKQIGVTAGHIIGSPLDAVTGETQHIRVTENKTPTLIASFKQKLKEKLFKRAQESNKAA